MRILITGAAGFIGYHLAHQLAQDPNLHLLLADNLQRGQRDAEFEALLARPNVSFYELDLMQPEAFLQLGAVDQVYHLAAMVGVRHCMAQPERVLDVNLGITQNLIRWLKTQQQPRVLFASTSEIYAGGHTLGVLPVPTPEQIPICIEDLANPRFSYAVSKMAGEQLIRFHAPGHYEFRIVRYHNIYGPRMGFAHVMPEVLRRIHAGEAPFKVFGHDQTRAFCYVADAVAQTIAVMNTGPSADPLYHLGNPIEEVKIQQLVDALFELTDYRVLCEHVAAPPGSVGRRCPDVSRLLEIWPAEWTPLREGLARTHAWYWPVIQQGRFHE